MSDNQKCKNCKHLSSINSCQNKESKYYGQVVNPPNWTCERFDEELADFDNIELYWGLNNA